MPINKKLHGVLVADAKFAKTANEQRIRAQQALDALILANAADQAAADKAVKDHAVFWKEMGLIENDLKENIDLKLTGKESFRNLQEFAVEQRVLMGLKQCDVKVLTSILIHNEDECVKYLQDKALATQFGPHVAGVDKNYFDEDAIDRIKKSALTELLLKLIPSSENAEGLQEIHDNLKNPDDLREALKDFLIKAGSPNSIELPDNFEELNDAVQEVLNKRLRLLAIAHYEKRIHELNAEELADDAIMDFINATDLQADLLPDIADDSVKDHLVEADLQNLRAQLTLRVIQENISQIAQKGDVEFLAVLNAADTDELKEAVKAAAQLEDEAEAAIADALARPDAQKNLRESMLKALISNLNAADLQQVYQAANAATVKTLLGINKISQAEMELMQKEARQQYFKNQLNTHSRIGAAAHQELVQQFEKLEKSAQIKAIENVSIIVNAQEPNLLRAYFKAPAAIAAENQRLDSFKRIHNAEIAKILAQYQPPINKLDDAQIKAINETIQRKINDDFSKPEHLAELVQVIAEKTEITDVKLYEAFGLEDEQQGDDATFDDDTLARAIQAKHHDNEELLKQLADPVIKEDDKAVIDVLLRLQDAIGARTFPKNIDHYKSVTAFIDNITPALSANEKKELTKEINPTVLHGLRAAFAKQQLADAATKDAAVNAINTHVGQMADTTRPLLIHAQGLLALQDFKQEQMASPKFQSQVQQDPNGMKARFEALSHEADLMVHRLRTDIAVMQSYLDSLPSNDTSLVSLHKDLKIEIKDKTALLQKYEAVQENLSGPNGALHAIDDITYGRGAKDWVILSRGWKITNVDNAGKEATPFTTENRDATAHIINHGTGADKIPGYQLDEQLTGNKSRRYELPTHVATKPGLTGQFTQRDLPTPVTATSGTHIKTDDKTQKFTLDKFPQGNNSDPDVIAARRAFSLGMAAQILASRSSAPTSSDKIYLTAGEPEKGPNVEAIKWVWTALVVLGEKNPNMKFGSNALEVDCTGFRPENEKSWMGFNSNSVYNMAFAGSSFFNPKKESGEEKSARLGVSNVSKHQQEANTSVDAFASATHKMKQQIDAVKGSTTPAEQARLETEKDIKDHGPAHSPGRSGGG